MKIGMKVLVGGVPAVVVDICGPKRRADHTEPGYAFARFADGREVKLEAGQWSLPRAPKPPAPPARCFECHGCGYLLVVGLDGEQEREPCSCTWRRAS